MNRLIEIGFEQVGHWRVENGRISHELTRLATQRNILYAFIRDGAVMYIGKTVSPLGTRMSGYRNPATSQSTNVRINKHITDCLAEGAAVDVYALPDNGLLHYGRFHVNLAAGLEDDLIRVINPPWNGGRNEVQAAEIESVKLERPDEEAVERRVDRTGEVVGIARLVAPDGLGGVPTPEALYGVSRTRNAFSFTLHPTYYRTGFFNVGVASEPLLGRDGETIEIYAGESNEPILGKINRTANQNSTPRIMGGTELRDWFEASADVMDPVHVTVFSPTAIRLRVPARHA